MSWQLIQEKFVRNFQDHNLPQGLLFYGPSGIGKKNFVLNLIQLSLKTRIITSDLCLILDAQINQDGSKKNTNLISIEEIRNNTIFNRTKSRSNNRFIIINGCDFLSISASNALLKSLEDTTQNLCFILIGEKPSKLPKTLISRLVAIKLMTPHITSYISSYPGQEPSLINYLYQSCKGNKIKITQLLQEEYLSIIVQFTQKNHLELLNLLIQNINLLEDLLPVVLFELLQRVKSVPKSEAFALIKSFDLIKQRAIDVSKYNLDFKKAFLSLFYKLINSNIDVSKG